MSSDAALRLVVVRHGETPWNAESRMQGRLDIALNAQGHAQARALADGLAGWSFDGVVHSGLLRTRQTLLPLLRQRAHAPSRVVEVPEFAERHYGIFQGLTPDERGGHHLQAATDFQRRDPERAPPAGESLRQFEQRVAAGVREILGQCAQAPTRAETAPQWLLCTHGGVLDLFYRWAHRVALEQPRGWPIPNAGISELILRPAPDHPSLGFEVECLRWAATEHLALPTERGEVEF